MKTVYSNHEKKGPITTFEAHLLPSLGYRSREDVDRWAWRFRKANPGLRVEVK